MAPKECTLCHTPRGVLVRCQIDESGTWNFVCTGKCWKSVSGGLEDAKGLEGQYPHYRYGGMVSILLSVEQAEYDFENHVSPQMHAALHLENDSIPML